MNAPICSKANSRDMWDHLSFSAKHVRSISPTYKSPGNIQFHFIILPFDTWITSDLTGATNKWRSLCPMAEAQIKIDVGLPLMIYDWCCWQGFLGFRIFENTYNFMVCVRVYVFSSCILSAFTKIVFVERWEPLAWCKCVFFLLSNPMATESRHLWSMSPALVGSWELWWNGVIACDVYKKYNTNSFLNGKVLLLLDSEWQQRKN